MNLLLDMVRCYLMIWFFTELASRIKENEQRKGRRKLSLSEFLNIAARHRTCIPTSIPSIRRLSSNDVKTHKETQRDGARLHNNLVESSKDKDKPGSKNKPRKRRHNNSSVDITGIKVTNRGQ